MTTTNQFPPIKPLTAAEAARRLEEVMKNEKIIREQQRAIRKQLRKEVIDSDVSPEMKRRLLNVINTEL